jgi:hypothetical protein
MPAPWQEINVTIDWHDEAAEASANKEIYFHCRILLSPSNDGRRSEACLA